MQFMRFASIAAAGFVIGLSAGGQITLSPNPTQLTPAAPQKHLPPGLPSQFHGVLMGYVYWDTASIQYNVNSPCEGFSVTLSQGTPPSGGAIGFEQFTVLGTYNNNFSSLGNVGNFAVCQYAVDHLPEDRDLKVDIHASPLNFKTVVYPNIPAAANDPNAPIKIINGKCNNLPPAVPSSSTLGGHWWSCGDHAYNVNYVLLPPKDIPGITAPSKKINLGQTQTLLSPSDLKQGAKETAPMQNTLLPSASSSTLPASTAPPKNQR